MSTNIATSRTGTSGTGSDAVALAVKDTGSQRITMPRVRGDRVGETTVRLFGSKAPPVSVHEAIATLSVIEEFRNIAAGIPREARNIITVFGRTTEAGRQILMKLIPAMSEDTPLLLTRGDTDCTLIASLADLRSDKWLRRRWQHTEHDLKHLNRSSILEQLLREVQEPGYASQGETHAVCPAETFAYFHNLLAPADYVRTLVSLFNLGEAAVAIGGLKAPVDALDPDHLDARSLTRSLYHSSILNGTCGAGIAYSNGRDVQFDSITGEIIGKGCSQAQILQMIERITGQAHYFEADPTVLRNWFAAHQQKVTIGSLHWSRPDSESQHAVVLQSRGDDLHIRNPWGNLLEGSDTNGSTADSQFKDERTGEEIMGLDVALARKLSVVLPLDRTTLVAELQGDLMRAGFVKLGNTDLYSRAGIIARVSPDTYPAIQFYVAESGLFGFPRSLALNTLTNILEITFPSQIIRLNPVALAHEVHLADGRISREARTFHSAANFTESVTNEVRLSQLQKFGFEPVCPGSELLFSEPLNVFLNVRNGQVRALFTPSTAHIADSSRLQHITTTSSARFDHVLLELDTFGEPVFIDSSLRK